jgi:hypothetical protein
MNKVKVENLKNFGETTKVLIKLNGFRNSQTQKGVKRMRYEQLHFHNKNKILRNSGQTYISMSKCQKKVIDGKNFKAIDSCWCKMPSFLI